MVKNENPDKESKKSGVEKRNLPTTKVTAKEPRISQVSGWLMMGTAIFFDGLAALIGLLDFLLPPVGTFFAGIVTGTGYATMWLWLAMKGVSILNSKKKTANFFGASLIEIIPYINLLPAVTFSTFRIITITKVEDSGIPIPTKIPNKK